jgi:hypothetical protein
MKKIKANIFILLFVCLCTLTSCINPFAPTAVDVDIDLPLLGDQKTVEGFFQNFLYAYNLKDTVVYGNLLAEDFIFYYRNYDKNLDLSWSRPEDMLTTYRLFNAAQNLEFVWNEIVINEGDTLKRIIARSFNLTITFNQLDVDHISGRVYFIIKRDNPNDDWKLQVWRDESNY